MRKLFMFCCMFAASICYAQPGNVGIGTSTPNAGAMLEVNSSTRAVLLPRLTSAALGSITTPGEGMTAYDLDKHSLVGYIGSVGNTVIAQNLVSGAVLINASQSFGQSFTPISTFLLQDIGIYLFTNDTTTTFIMDIYSGFGASGTKLGTTTLIRSGSTTGTANFNFSSLNLTLQSGQTYSFQITPNVSANKAAQVGINSTSDSYSAGAFLYNGNPHNPGWDFYFEIRTSGTGGWQRVLTDKAENGGANMLSAGYGNVFSNATNVISNSSNNCILNHTLNTGIYDITFIGSNLASVDIATLAVTTSLFGSTPGFITFTGSAGKLTIRTFNAAGVLTDRGFGFSVFKP